MKSRHKYKKNEIFIENLGTFWVRSCRYYRFLRIRVSIWCSFLASKFRLFRRYNGVPMDIFRRISNWFNSNNNNGMDNTYYFC